MFQRRLLNFIYALRLKLGLKSQIKQFYCRFQKIYTKQKSNKKQILK